MRPLTALAFSCSLFTLALLPLGCGDDEEPIRVNTGQEDSGTSQSGGSGAEGGAGGTGGGNPTTGGAGGSPASCNPATCEPLAVAGFTLPGCCATPTTCGVDTSSVAALLMGVLPAGCIDLSGLTGDGGPVIPGDGGPPVTVNVDGGIVDVPGGDDIHLDPSCPGVEIQNPFAPISAPGCCTPDNYCGGSTHEIVSGGLPLSLGCYRNAEFAPLLSSAFGGFDVSGFLTIPPDPNQACTYSPEPPEGGVSTPEAGSPPEAGTPTTDSGTPADASVADASAN